jgi:hypothetical protein
MHIFALLLFLAVVTSCQNSGGRKLPNTRESELNSEFHPFLREGEFNVEYYSGKIATPEQRKIFRKLSSHIKVNAKAQKFIEHISDGEKLGYTSDLGISKKEYTSLVDLFSYKDPEKSSGTLTVIRDGNNFSFKGIGGLSLLDSVSVKLNSKTAFFKQYSMDRAKDSTEVEPDEIPDGDKLDDFELYIGPEGILGLTGLDGEYELLIGRLKPSGRIYLHFFAKQPDNIEHPIPEHITIIFPII